MYNDFYMPLVYNVHDFYMSLGVPNPFRYLAYIVNNATQKHSIAQNLKVGGNPESSTKKKSFLWSGLFQKIVLYHSKYV